jgi:hypothetical protein
MANCYFAKATRHATLLHPFLYVIDSKRALNFGQAHDEKIVKECAASQYAARSEKWLNH